MTPSKRFSRSNIDKFVREVKEDLVAVRLRVLAEIDALKARDPLAIRNIRSLPTFKGKKDRLVVRRGHLLSDPTYSRAVLVIWQDISTSRLGRI